jgi:hypothetical protein
MAASKLTAQQQRDRRAKIVLAVLGVVLLGVLGLQLPKILKSGGSSSATPPPETSTTSATTPGGSFTASASGTVNGQLASFSRFAKKDPFRPLVKAAVSQGSATSTTSAPAASQPAPAATPNPKPDKPQAPPLTLTVKSQPVPTGPLVPAALLTFDGKKHVVAMGATFPAKHPLFKLVAISDKAVWLRLVGGSLSNGSQTLKLLRGHPVTLVNATAGTRFVLALIKPTATKPPVASTTPAAPAPAPTTTATSTTATSPSG